MKALVMAAVLCVAGVVSAEEKLGTGVSLTEVTPIVALSERPADFVGKTIRIDGVATAICEHMGCWMAVSESDKADAPTVRLKVEDGVIVFPVRVATLILYLAAGGAWIVGRIGVSELIEGVALARQAGGPRRSPEAPCFAARPCSSVVQSSSGPFVVVVDNETTAKNRLAHRLFGPI